ncbi:hypothetical protein Hypma_004287 [Hypsizygus marmoreus]|uniref:DUF6535 domain-containing protein n=1 Tax=Hypsizygus marmoreus TaxID=39966 RepID=A0A369K1C0_HYPMA|nr:hypothetical protein Hypma_004287 [Hypsizygus marmoreus]
MQRNASSAEKHRRRPFGPRVHLKEADLVQTDDRHLHARRTSSPEGSPSVPWSYYPPASHSDGLKGVENPGQSNPTNPIRRSRPLPPKPRNTLNGSRRRPLPSTSTTLSETHDIPFLFSSRSSQFTHIDTPDPIKDPFGAPEGIPSDAPIWKSYMDEAKGHDQNNIANWNQSMDVILIFAALFSAILTAFLIEFYHPLQPDLQQAGIDQLMIITHLLEASLTGLKNSSPLIPGVIPSDKPHVAPGAAAGVNILWFVSLTCSLGAAIGAMVIKQWLQFYMMGLSPNPYEYAHQHQYRYKALVAWHVPGIVSALPFIMLFSVGLFLVGLGLQLLQLHFAVAIASIGFMSAVLLCYFLSLVLSIIYPACPYKTSAMVLLKSLGASAWSFFQWLRCLGTSHPISHAAVVDDDEITEIRNHQPELAVSSISWLLEVSQQEEAMHNALLSVSKFSHTYDMIQKLQSCNAMEQLVQRALVPLPPLGHEFWKTLNQITSAHPVFLKFSRAKLYIRNLIAVWHHPSYLGPKRPPAISQNHEMERQAKTWEMKNLSSKSQNSRDVENISGM